MVFRFAALLAIIGTVFSSPSYSSGGGYSQPSYSSAGSYKAPTRRTTTTRTVRTGSASYVAPPPTKRTTYIKRTTYVRKTPAQPAGPIATGVGVCILVCIICLAILAPKNPDADNGYT